MKSRHHVGERHCRLEMIQRLSQTSWLLVGICFAHGAVMRLFCTLLLLLAAGCAGSALTIPATSIAPYAAGEAVQTQEGVSLSLKDGGRVLPIPVDDGTFRVMARQSLEWAGGTRDMVYLGDRIDGSEAPDELSTVRDVVEIEHGSATTILGTRTGVRASSAHVGGLRVTGSKKNGGGLGAGAIAGIAIGSAAAGAALIGLGVYGLTQIEVARGFGGSYSSSF